MSAISTASINPPIPSLGVVTGFVETDSVEFTYASPPALTSDNLGYSVSSTTLLTGATITGANQNVLLCQLTNQPAGTYIASYSATLNAVQPDIQSYLQIVATSGGAVIATSADFFLTGTNTQYESTTGVFTFTASVPFNANLYGSTGGGGGTGTPVNPIFLQITRLA
jgi:hypothetical protein